MVAAVLIDGLSRRQAAIRFGDVKSTAVNWLKRVETTGTVAPGSGGRPQARKIAGEHRDWLVQRCRERDLTLRGLWPSSWSLFLLLPVIDPGPDDKRRCVQKKVVRQLVREVRGLPSPADHRYGRLPTAGCG